MPVLIQQCSVQSSKKQKKKNIETLTRKCVSTQNKLVINPQIEQGERRTNVPMEALIPHVAVTACGR